MNTHPLSLTRNYYWLSISNKSRCYTQLQTSTVTIGLRLYEVVQGARIERACYLPMITPHPAHTVQLISPKKPFYLCLLQFLLFVLSFRVDNDILSASTNFATLACKRTFLKLPQE